ncbi:oxidoreductase [Loktanella sp. D2R18]|uniref:aldo/keto reductase n=1 Tax=Rhodobacterales TaxID=204455 RepID=UPI000DE87FAA|nr:MULTISPECIES: aldo/keto reductase [Rhodobacterales]MDO6591170.1 aldo/keto reductase [Yoonia sp. 1_MG-2023]RBW41509.1 oxidoreductase [Loktanella sp. D2R18]
MPRIDITPDLSFSQIVYGMWRIGDDADTSVAHIEAKIQSCLAQGITTFDQADIYGGYAAEDILGTALKANPALRPQMEIVTKCDIVAPMGRYEDAKCKHYDTSRAHITSSVDYSLAAMGIEQIDLLLIHRPDPLMDHNETGVALDEIVKSGKVRAVGVSNFKLWDWELLQSGMNEKLVTNQVEISASAITPFTNGDIAFHQRHDHPMMAWSPLGGGDLMTGQSALTDRMDEIAKDQGVDRAAVAVAFLLRHPAKILPVLGTNNLERIGRLSDALSVTISRQDWFYLYESALGTEVA